MSRRKDSGLALLKDEHDEIVARTGRPVTQPARSLRSESIHQQPDTDLRYWPGQS